MEVVRYTVVPDSHGQYGLIGRMVDAHLRITDRFLFLGDVLNGPDSANLIRLIRELGERAITIVGNHEWVGRNALTETDDPMVSVWQNEVWPGYEQSTLQSYGIHQTSNWARNAEALRETMGETGDLAWLHSLPPYYETSEFIGLHAGPDLEYPWADQAAALDQLIDYNARLYDEPAPIFSGKNGRIQNVPELVDTRTFVTGHLHLRLPPVQRMATRKIGLASPLDRGAPLYVWQSDQNRIYGHS
jgi:hypothetical protein